MKTLREELLRRLDYDKERGELRRKPGFKGTVAGALIGTPDSNGKLQATFLGKRYQVDALIWLIETGELPSGVLFHTNGDNADNRFEFLQDVTRSERGKMTPQGTEAAERRRKRRARTMVRTWTPRTRYPDLDKAYADANREIYRKAGRDHYNRTKASPSHRAKRACRAMLIRWIKSAKAGRQGATETMLGYSFEEFRTHIESLMRPGMSWANHGDWHVDHIKPIDAFLAEGVTDPAIVNALANLQPLPASENISKGARYPTRPPGGLRVLPLRPAAPAV